jgi:hypothetical protein
MEAIYYDGIISVLNKEGVLVGELIIEKISEITGIFISHRVKECLFLTERNSAGIYKMKISSFISELDKMFMETNKNNYSISY